MAAVLIALLLLPKGGQPHEPIGCGSNIVSATVVATLCGHREGDVEILDLLILWRGQPGWFERRLGGGSRGSQVLPPGRSGSVTRYDTYNDVTIGFSGDFDRRHVTIEQTAFNLDEVNAVVVDAVDDPITRHVAGRRRVPSRLPLAGDMNLSAIRQSPALVAFLQCEIPMPVARGGASMLPPVITVCEKIRAK